MRALAGDAVVERMHSKVDQRIRQPAIPKPIIALARTLGQRLQRRLQRGSADLVKDALHENDAIVDRREGKTPLLDALLLFLDEALRVAGVARVHAGMAE